MTNNYYLKHNLRRSL